MNKPITRTALIAATTVVLSTSVSVTAHAQNNVDAPSLVQLPPAADHDREPVSPRVALTLSLLGTAVGYGSFIAGLEYDNNGLAFLGIAGIVIGPSIGHIYTGDVRRELVTTSVRGLGVLVTGVGAVMSFSDCLLQSTCNSPGPALSLAGALVTVGGTIYSIVDSRRSARRANERNERWFALTPAPMLGPDRSMGMGMVASGSF